MNTPLILLNILFYSITIYLYDQAKRDPSISLGIGFMFLLLWIVFPILQLILWRLRVIKVNTWLDKVGMFTTTPVLSIIAFIAFTQNDNGEARSSTTEYNRNGYRYQEAYYDYSGTSQVRKVEFYRSVDTVSDTNPFPKSDKWVKDSIWIYYSNNGDTIRKEQYSNDTLIKTYGG